MCYPVQCIHKKFSTPTLCNEGEVPAICARAVVTVFRSIVSCIIDNVTVKRQFGNYMVRGVLLAVIIIPFCHMIMRNRLFRWDKTFSLRFSRALCWLQILMLVAAVPTLLDCLGLLVDERLSCHGVRTTLVRPLAQRGRKT